MADVVDWWRASKLRPTVRPAGRGAAPGARRATIVALGVAILLASIARAAEPTAGAPASSDAWPAANHRFSPDGEPGSLVLPGGVDVSEASLAAFVELAGGRKSRLVVLEIVAADANARTRQTALSASLFSRWQTAGGQTIQVVRRSLDEFRGETAERLCEGATGLWLNAADDATLRQLFTFPGWKEACETVRNRGGVIGGDVSFTRLVGERLATTVAGGGDGGGDAKTESAPVESKPNADAGLGWLPGCAIVLESTAADALAEQWRRQPLTVAVRLSNHATLALQGRLLRSVNDNEIRVEFAPATGRPDQTVLLNDSKRPVDLTALRRTAVDRASAMYPPAELPEPRVDKGTLIIVGGGRTPRGLLEKFVVAAGGRQASIVVIPISMPDPLPEKDPMVEACRKLGAAEVTLLTGRTPQAVDQPETLERLRKATGIWFGGGRQWRFVDAYEGTEAFGLMHDVLRRGGVIAGSSAGATIQGDYLVRGSPLGPQFMMADGYERAFRFLPGVGIDQHFTQRNRQPDMRAFMRRYPQYLGIGIDESTALIVRGSTAEIYGEHRVHFYDPRRGSADEPYIESLAAGQQYDLPKRAILPAKEEPAKEEPAKVEPAKTKAESPEANKSEAGEVKPADKPRESRVESRPNSGAIQP